MYALLRSDYFELNTLSPKSSGVPCFAKGSFLRSSFGHCVVSSFSRERERERELIAPPR